MKKLRSSRKIILLAISMLLIFKVSYGQDETDLPAELGTAQGVHKIHLEPSEIPEELKDIDYIYFEKIPGTGTKNPPMDSNRRVKITGRLSLKDGRRFAFKEAYFTRNAAGDYQGIAFATVDLNGISYTFQGEFLADNEYNEKIGGYTRIKGALNKQKERKTIAAHLIPLYEYAEL